MACNSKYQAIKPCRKGEGGNANVNSRYALKKRENIMKISKYEQTLSDQSRHIIESDEIIKPILDKIEDLDNDLSITTTKVLR
jgi:hypothetical protein